MKIFEILVNEDNKYMMCTDVKEQPPPLDPDIIFTPFLMV